MRFALFGDHPDGLDMARALVESGRHELVYVAGVAHAETILARHGLGGRSISDIEEVLADPAIEAVIIAGAISVRASQARRALQSERHVLCVHPIDPGLDSAYEVAMIQRDTRRVLMPLLTESIHPGVTRLAVLARAEDGPLGTFALIEVERRGPASMVWGRPASADAKVTLPSWAVLRAIRGEIAEVSAYAANEEIDPEKPLFLTGRFERGGVFQATLVPNAPDLRWRITVTGSKGKAALAFPEGWPGAGHFVGPDETGTITEQEWRDWNPWPVLVDAFETATRRWAERAAPTAEARPRSFTAEAEPGPIIRAPTWHDEIRSLELDDAARRSVAKRRGSTLEYQEVSEEAGFKGTMTLVGCSIIWVILGLAIASRWMPRLGWLIIPLLVVFLGMQVLRWALPRDRA